MVEEAVEVFKAAVDLVEAVVAAAAMEVAEVISLKLNQSTAFLRIILL